MRKGAIVRLVAIALLAAAVATAVALFVPWLPPVRLERSRADRLRLLGGRRDLHRRVRGRRRGHHLLGRDVPRAAGRRRRRPADPRPHGPRDRVDGHPGCPRHGDRRLSAVALAREREAEDEPAPGRRHGAAVRVELQVPAARRTSRRTALRLEEARQVELNLHGARRHPLVLGARVPAEAGRRARDRHALADHADQARARTRSSAPSSAGSGMP